MPRKGVMLAVPFELRRLNKWFDGMEPLPRVLVQPKYNGVRLRWTGSRLLSSEGNEVTLLPKLLDELGRWFNGKQLDGEGYVHGMKLQEIRGIVSRRNERHPLADALSFYVFDIPAEREQSLRLSVLKEAKEFEVCEKVRLSPYWVCRSMEEIVTVLEQQVELGFEGIVVRHPQNTYFPLDIGIDAKRSTMVMKWKPAKRDTYIIADAFEGEGKYKGTLGALQVKDKEDNLFHVGSFAIDDKERAHLWRQHQEGALVGRAAKIRYFDLSAAGIPPSSVFELLI